MAPALAGLIIDFFYTGSTSLGTLFPEVFVRKVPKSVTSHGPSGSTHENDQ